ncbi:tRNA pseudouridine(55) synthase TruB [Anaerolineales bacterium]
MDGGFLNIHKPAGLTSHDVVAKIRRLLKQSGNKLKVGHAGTLDPMATGVLVVCVGQATRLSDYVMHQHKIYQAGIHLGIETDTYDAEGQVTSTQSISTIDETQIRQALSQFIGNIEQIPPMYSAIKVDGKKLYELAREGTEIERKSRSVYIEKIDLIQIDLPRIMLDIYCGPGTYIRSIAHDLGQKLNTVAHLYHLSRLKSGHFYLKDALELDTLTSDNILTYLQDPLDALSDWHRVHLAADQQTLIFDGVKIETSDQEHDRALAVNAQGALCAILEKSDTFWKPLKVFH